MTLPLRYVLLTPLAVSALAMPAAASAATKYKASATDPTGDGPLPGRDITEVKFSYKKSGALTFAITTAGPIDAVNADAAPSISLGSSCKKVIGLGGGLFSDTSKTGFAAVKGKKVSKPKKGKAEIVGGNVYKLTFKSGSFKNWKPGCIAFALVDPATVDSENPTVFDQTDEIKIKK